MAKKKRDIASYISKDGVAVGKEAKAFLGITIEQTIEELEQLGKPLEKLPWKDLKIPKYPSAIPRMPKASKIGNLRLTINNSPLVRGYFRGLQLTTWPNVSLIQNDTLWMSLAPMEIESQAPHVDAAYGNVVVVGGGMGLAAYNIAIKKNVKKITVVEIDPDITLLLSVLFKKWKLSNRIELVQGNIFKMNHWKDIDFLYVDIWTDLGSKSAIKDTRTIQGKVKAKHVSYWGQELDFIVWCAELGYMPPPTYSQVREWVDTCTSKGLPLKIKRNWKYHHYAFVASKNVMQY